MIDGKNFFDQPINSDLKTYENIRRLVKEMITQPVACKIILISKKTTK